MGGLFYITLKMNHGEDPIRGLCSAGADSGWDGNGVTLSCVVYWEYRDPITLLYLPFHQGFICSPHLSSPHRGLSCSESAVHSFV